MSMSLTEVARRSDEAMAQARAELVRAVRKASSRGMTQSQIAREVGRSQPEVSRLLHFRGTSPLARVVRRHAAEVRRLVAEVGGSRVRVFGSLARGDDRPGSDVDLLFSMREPLSLMELGRLEQRLADLLGAPVDLVPDSTLRPDLREQVDAEAAML